VYAADQGASSGDVLSIVNYLQALRSEKAIYIPGVFLTWELMVGNSNTRWHWGSAENTSEPAIPWCGLMWADG
jgi:hypothetical protein